jgi:hypothetical protein
MRAIVLALLLLFPGMARAGDMQKYLSDTQELVRRGEPQQALTRFIWFHEHALEHEPAMYGVRLSFALSYWKSLGAEYPPALDAMVEIRDRSAARLLSGKPQPSLFHDVVSLNRTLEEDDRTVELFERLDAERPQDTRDLWEMAKEALFAAKRYDLIAKYLGNPLSQFTKITALYDMNTSMYDDDRFKDPHFREYNENSFVEECVRLIEISVQIGNDAAALDIQQKALSVLDDARLRAALPEQTPGQ